MASFKIGDLVRLRSGSPTLPVEESASVTCIWFHGEKRKYHAFKADALQPHKPASVSSVRIS
jgi:uncharacterized protein YodC (DUF2158 family)